MKKRLFLLLLILVGFLVIYLFHPFILEGMARFLIVQDRLESADIIVVLAGDGNGERVGEGVNLYRLGYAKKMLMSGGPLAWNLTSAERMKEHALTLGVLPEDILLEDKSMSTLENAKFSLPVLKRLNAKRIILVTSPTHSRRAGRVFKKFCTKEGIKIISYPVQQSKFVISKWWKRHEDTQRVVWEYLALLFYFLKGY